MTKYLILLVFALFAMNSCNSKHKADPTITSSGDSVMLDSLFSDAIGRGKPDSDKLNEVSGMASSVKNAAGIWLHNDSGGEAIVYMIDFYGKLRAEYKLKKTKLRDWEDIACIQSPHDSTGVIYLGEIGDNAAKYNKIFLYRFEEPKLINSEDEGIQKGSIKNIQKLEFEYEDGQRDAEALLVDPLTEDVYIISKREKQVGVYYSPYPQREDSVNVLRKIQTIDFNNVVAADISADGSEVLVKTYYAILYWKRNEGESLAQLFSRPPVRLPYEPEPQGEAICWQRNGAGYFTLSEKSAGIEPVLYYYKRLDKLTDNDE